MKINKPRPKISDVLRLLGVVRPFVQAILMAGPNDRAIIEVPIKRTGKKPWQWRLDGDPVITVHGA